MAKVMPEDVINGLVARGYEPHQAAGIAGNLALESNFDTSIQEIDPKTESARRQGGGFGLAQWTSADRKQGLYNMAQMRGVPVDNLDLQLDYLDHELKTTHKKALKALQSSTNPRQAAFAISRYYEMPAAKYAHNSQRMGMAEKLLNMINPIGTANADETPYQEPEINEQDYLKALEQVRGQAKPAQPELSESDYLKALAQVRGNASPEKTAGQKVGDVITDIGGGVLKGASNIGNSILSAADSYNELVGNKYALSSLDNTGAERRQQATEGLKSMGVDTASDTYKAAELGTEIAGTAGVGGLAAGAVKGVPAINKLAPAIESWGMQGGNIAKKAAGGAITGAASSALVDPETAATGGVVGAVLPPAMKAAGKFGGLVGAGVNKALTSGKGISQEVKDLAKKAEDYGIDIPIDKIANSKPLNALAKSLEYVPFSGREATQETLHKQVNRAVSRTIGQDNHNINKALRDADLNLSGQFEKTLQENAVKLDDAFIEGLARVEKEAESILIKDQFAVIKKQIDNILEKGGSGQLDGQAAYNIKKLLDKLGKGSDTTKASVAIDLKRELMDALDRSLGAEKAAAFKKVREQYGNMLELEKIAKNGAEGEISIARLANMKNTRSKELKDLADIAAQFVTEREGQHGAMQRVLVGGAAGATAGLPGLAAGAIGGRALNTMLNNKSLRNRIIGENVKKTGGNKFASLARHAPKLIPAAAQE